MISPSVWLLIAYTLTVLLCVAVYAAVHANGARKLFFLLAAVIVLAGSMYALFWSMEALFGMAFLPLIIFLVGIIGSSWVAILCIREQESTGFKFSSVVTAFGFFLFFLLLLIMTVPEFYYCTGCNEWH